MLFARGTAAYNWGLDRVSTEFSPRAGDSNGMKERFRAVPFVVQHVPTHSPAGTDCPGKSKATEGSECLLFCKKISSYWFIPGQNSSLLNPAFTLLVAALDVTNSTSRLGS